MKSCSFFSLLSAIVCLWVVAIIAGCGGSKTTAPNSGTSQAPPTVALAVTSISPTSIPAGATALTLTVNGSGFQSASTVQVNGVSVPTTYVSATQLTAVVPASSLVIGTMLQVAVLNGTSSSANGGSAISLEVDNLAPVIAGFSPTGFLAGAAPVTISVTGSGFIPATVIQVNGNIRSTTYVSATQVNATLTANDLANPGSLALVAVNPAPGGGTSAGASLPVSNPMPGAISITPSSVAAGKTTTTTVTVMGTNLISGSVAQVNGSARPTVVVSSTQLSFQLTVADQAAAGQLQVNVVNPAPGGGTSASARFTVTAPAGTPVISRVSPAQLIVGSANTNIQVIGSNLIPAAIVQWNGTNLPTGFGFNSSFGNYLVATVSTNLLATTGTANITVNNASATPPLSNVIQVKIVNPPPPTLTSLSTLLVPTGKAATITLYGTSFTPASTVALNGVDIPSTSIYTTQITATIPASALPAPGINTLTVSNPFGTSAPLSLTAYVPIINNSMIYNPINGLFYLSVPSAAGAPYGNTVVSIDPLTGAIGIPVPVGSEPNRLAITSDGRYLWVALDGAAAVRKVDLVTGTAGLQFSIGGAVTVAALAALPGATDSVVVSTVSSLTIYDTGVARSSAISFNFDPFPWALIVDGTKNEIYGPGNFVYPGGYNTYKYSAAGITLNSSTSSNLTYAANNTDDVQIAGGRLYTSYGQVVDPESGSLLGTFYSSGTTAAQGSVTVDTVLGKAFVLEGSSDAFGGFTGTIGSSTAQLAAFNTSEFTATSSAPIPISIPTYRATYQYAGPTGSRLTRWGSNGLAFRGTGGFVSLRASLVQDLSTVNADLGVTITSSGTNSTGNTTTYAATITNNGPASASSVGLTAFIPSTSILASVMPSTGSCSTTGTVLCNLGGLSNGASATVVFNILQTSAGSAAMSVQVNASETDPVSANNQATSTINITGGTYNVAPTLSTISPAAIVSGSSDTVITVNGSGFSSSSIVLLNGTVLSTSFTSSTQLSATVPAANLANLGWAPIVVSNPAPGGGISSALPLSIFSVLNLGANHILYDPYSRKIMASVGTGTSTIAGNSLVAITPDTATLGTAVPIGGTPTILALTSDGQILYALLPGTTTGSIARFNMLTQQPDFTVSGFQATGYEVGLDGIATQPGTENTIAVNEGQYIGMSIFDLNLTSKTAVRRGVATGIYSGGTCIVFPNASSLLLTGGSTLNTYSVTSNGLVNDPYPYYVASNLQSFGCSKLDGGILYAGPGGVANANVSPAVQLGTFEGLAGIVNDVTIGAWAPDTSLGLSFYLTDASPNNYSGIFDSITAFSNQTFMPTTAIPLPVTAIEGTTGVTGVEVVRWGEDGLAVLSSGGHVYLVRGGAVVPQLLTVNSAAILTAGSLTSATHGAGNTSLTLTGSNFLPGVAVLWNGSYRTTTIVDAAHVSVAIPASDLANAGTATLTAANPGAVASTTLAFSIN